MAKVKQKSKADEKIRRIDSYVGRVKPATETVPNEDLLSQLPDDCLISIFSRLDRGSLNEAKCASKRLHHVASHDSLKRVKRHKQRIFHITHMGLKRSCAGYSVILHFAGICRTITVPNKPTKKWMNGNRCGAMIDENAALEKKIRKTNGNMDEYTGRRKAYDTCIDCDTPQSAPTQFYDLIEKFTDEFTIEALTLINITIDDMFIDRISKLLKGNVLYYGFNLCNSSIDTNLPVDKFSQFLASLEASRILISDPRFPFRMLDEQFVINFPSSELRLEIAKSSINRIHKFSPSTDFAPVLLRFDRLHFPGLILDLKTILRAFKVRLSSPCERLTWNVASDSSEVDLSIFDNAEYTITKNEVELEFERQRIQMKKRDMKGDITITIDKPNLYEESDDISVHVEYFVPYVPPME